MTCSPNATLPESISKQRFLQVNVKDECLAVHPAESATLRRNKVRILASNTSEVQGLLIQSSAPASKRATIAILAGVVNFLPHPNPPREFGEGVRNSQMI